MGVGGEDYAIIAASTRMSTSFSILTRHSSKFTQLCEPNLRQMLAPLCHQSVHRRHLDSCCLSYATSATRDLVGPDAQWTGPDIDMMGPAQSTRSHHRHGGHAGGHADAAQDAAGTLDSRKLLSDVLTWCLMSSNLSASLQF